MSDLHFEFYTDRYNKKYIQSLADISRAECVILAGDICLYNQHLQILSWFAEAYPLVVHVAGNHDYWNSTFKELEQQKQELQSKYSNLHWLTVEDGIKEIEGKRFWGDTFWFKRTDITANKWNRWIDYRKSKEDFPVEAILGKHESCIKSLESYIGQPQIDVVLTHHLPSEKSCDPEFTGDPSNAFFASNYDVLIEQLSPRYWIHGHTHKACNYTLGNTRVLCNPGAYPHEDSGWNPWLVIDI
jgi:Icc-related predicted phosphoesterase